MSEAGILYVVATPIGNLGDISQRALEVLRSVQYVAAEDTRRSRGLLEHFGIRARLRSYHDHSDSSTVARLLDVLQQGESVALISDAGTPLLADPGFPLVREAHRRGFTVVPLPGPCAAVAALSAAGLPCERFVFEGFLPAKPAARRARLRELRQEPRTMVLYEAPHRLPDTLADAVAEFGAERAAVLARELTKRFETILHGTLGDLVERVAADADQRRGELVLLIAGNPRPQRNAQLQEGLRVLSLLEPKLSHKDAVAIASRISGCSRNALYEASLKPR